MGILIHNGTVVTAEGRSRADVLIEGERIVQVAPAIDPAGHTAGGCDGTACDAPAASDVHTHLDMPFGGTVSADDYRTGTIAAAVGGTTSVIDFRAAVARPTPLHEALETWLAKSKDKACIDYSLHMAITDLGPKHEALDAMADMIDAGHFRASSSSWRTPTC